MLSDQLNDLSRRFRRFALKQALPSGPLYSELALGIAEDPSMLRLAQQCATSPVTSLFLAAVHDLLLRGVDHPLRSFYPDLTPEPQSSEKAFPVFRSFCRAHEAAIRKTVATRRVQTNEVRRCIYLAPGFDLIAREAPAYAVIDVGASAGLHLLWPHFGYDYEGHRVGDPASPVQLSCRFEGDLRPALPQRWPEPARQIGIDLNPLDAANPEDERWLRALVWPEHGERAALLERALAVARDRRPFVVAGDAIDMLPDLVSYIPTDEACCVCHNHTLNQWPDMDRMRFDALLGELASSRTIYRLSTEWIGTEKPELTLTRYRKGRKSQCLIARVDDFGAWVEWAAS